MKASLDAGEPVTLPKTQSIADGLMPVRPGDLTFAHVRRFVDAVVTVDDEAIADAVLWTFANAKMVAEPSGAATVAAVLSGAVDRPRRVEGTIVAIISGGNISLEKLVELSKRAPAARARRDQPPPRLRRSAGASAKAEVAERDASGGGAPRALRKADTT
jgi:threonine dehydratase